MNSKARKTNLFNATRERGFRDFISRVIMVVSERKKQVVIEQTFIS